MDNGPFMLDFSILKSQINQMVGEQRSRQDTYRRRAERALKELNRWQDWRPLGAKLTDSKTSWLLAGDLGEPLTTRYPLVAAPPSFTVIAADGSQIFPDRHELTLCYLINISSIVLHYGTGTKPLLASRPTLFYKEEDLYKAWNNRKIPVDGEIVGIQRSLMEFQELAHLAKQLEGQDLPVLALCDGTLILWHLEVKPEDFGAYVLSKFLETLEYFRGRRIPIAGYISYPRSTDVINALRVGMCPEHPVNCDKCPYRQDPELPCEPIEGMIDSVLFSHLLGPGERTTVFKSSSKILEEYGVHAVYFFYLNVGSEIARIEVPQWVARDRDLLNRTQAMIYDQAEKGHGYPVSLAEAHEKAVVRGADRELFYQFLRDSFVRQNLRVQVSRKSYKKKNVSI